MGIDVFVDLRERLGPARNQGARPTCMAFAASDTHSFAQGMTKYLSVEYAHYKAVFRRKPLNPNRGVPIWLMINAVREDGQPPEDVWPYATVIPSPLSAWVPPKNCTPIFRHSLLRKTADMSNIFSALNAEQATLLVTRITEQFYSPATDHIIKTIPNDRDAANHAVVAVGHGKTGRDALVLVRNSWGKDWADNGHAWVTKDYLESHLLGVAVPFN